MIRPFLISLQFLTVLPVRVKGEVSKKDSGRSLIYYPLVGLVIGLLLAALGWFGNSLPAGLHAALVLAFWIALTGALHLDGLADSADAWMGGLGNREKTLAIMKDPCCGPIAVVVLVVFLLIKFAALEYLLSHEYMVSLILVPVLGRAALILLFLTTPYVRSEGLGKQFSNHLPHQACIISLFVCIVLVQIFIGVMAFWLLIALLVVFILMRTLMQRRLGGTTGDTAGALVEITETVLLTAAVLLV